MSTIIKFDLKELKKLALDKNSCVVEKKVTQNLALQPWCLGNLKESLKNLLDYKIGKFDKEFNGILLSYKNLRVLQNIGSIRNDNSEVRFQVQAEYFVFRPYVGATLKGIVNKKSATHLGVLVHRVFNIVITRPTEEPGNKWIGASLQEGQEVVFRIVVLDLFGALPYIRGELDERWLQLGPYGDEAAIVSKPQTKSVSYVNFDKTKPYSQKQSGDGLRQSSTKSSSPPRSRIRVSSVSGTTSANVKPIDNVDSMSSHLDRNKIKRQSKIVDRDPKQTEQNKNYKKYKKDDAHK